MSLVVVWNRMKQNRVLASDVGGLSVYAVLALTCMQLSGSWTTAWATDGSEGSQAPGAGTPSPTVKHRTMLTGSAKHAQPLNSSVKLVKPAGIQSRSQTARTPAPIQRLFYIPNAPVLPFHRQSYPEMRPRTINPLVPIAETRPADPPLAKAATTKPSTGWDYAITPANGVMSWAPGFETVNVPTQKSSSQLALHSNSNSGNDAASSLSIMRSGARDLAARTALRPQLRATPGLLSETLFTKSKRSDSWDEWYKSVCNTVYNQWLFDDTGPGKACIRVVVWSSRDLECRITDFAPAPDAERNSVKESEFRLAAVKAVNSLDHCAVLEFPLHSQLTQVSFELDMNRMAEGPTGCQVVMARKIETPKH